LIREIFAQHTVEIITIDTSTVNLVLESPVQSGFLPIFGKTETETGLSVFQDRKKPDWTDLNRSFAVSIGSKTGYDRSRSKPVSTGPRPVQTGNS
jgi:hypothetical protein